MKKKLLIVGISFIALICIQIFSSGHEHVVVVEDNIQLTGENKQLTKANKSLTNSVNKLKEENQELTEDKENLESMVAEVIGDLDSTQSVVKQIKKELTDEKDINIKQSTGDQFDFQPIKLPAEDGNQR
jgi:predicted RNase H-like nuclease (RuvC/YqgF family)